MGADPFFISPTAPSLRSTDQCARSCATEGVTRRARGYSIPVTVENTGVALARQATEALRRLDDEGRTLRPDGVDHFTWTADVLDELARLAETLGRAVEHVSGEQASGAESHAQALATAIVAHRNSLLRHGRGERPSPGGGDRTFPRVVAEQPRGGITPVAVAG
ncbi:hypothetical protein [Actinomycetospora flava]|uniref:Uncharacterized protein n=1 Tax=Actinomycetospora flava TaxID=3129232 RepID=A0ABU8M6H5_9PSEU